MAEGTNLIATVSSATRPPGRYTLTWDGRDTQGRLVKAGEYTVYVEAAREHGTYQITRQAISVPGPARRLTMTGNVEVTAATLDYHQVARK